MSYDSEPIEATVAELKPRMKNLTINFKVLEIEEEREVESRRDNTTHRVADARVGDSSGTVQVPLWDENIDSVDVGTTYILTNGYTGLFRGNLRLNIGKYGKLDQASEAIEEIDEDNDMSAAEHEDERRSRGGGYGGRGGGGYSRSSRGGYGGDSYGGSNRDRRSGGYGGRDRRRRY